MYGAIPWIYPIGFFCMSLKPPCWQPTGSLSAGLQWLSVRAELAVSAPGTKQTLQTRMPRLWEQRSHGAKSRWAQTGTMVKWCRLYHPNAWIQILLLLSANRVTWQLFNISVTWFPILQENAIVLSLLELKDLILLRCLGQCLQHDKHYVSVVNRTVPVLVLPFSSGLDHVPSGSQGLRPGNCIPGSNHGICWYQVLCLGEIFVPLTKALWNSCPNDLTSCS